MKVTSNVKSVLGKADKKIYGHFLEHFHRQVYGGVFDPDSKFADNDGFRTDVIEAMKKINVPIIRWPGGCFVSSYHWKNGIGKNRIPEFSKAWRIEEPNLFGTDEYVKLCKKIGCEPYICTNAGTGSPEEMSDWVEYCNLKDQGYWAKKRISNGYAEPHNVKYWSIGNENYGSWEIGAWNSDQWGPIVRESAKMMLKVDSTIELSAAALADPSWNYRLLRDAGQYLRWISIHGYWADNFDGIKTLDFSKVVLLSDKSISDPIDKARAILTTLGLDKKIRIAFDEWNLRFWYHPRSLESFYTDKPLTEDDYLTPRDLNDRNQTYTMSDAVFSACFLNTCLKNCDIVGMACFSPIVNTRGAIFTYKDGIVLRPSYYVFDLFSNYMKDNILNSWKWESETIEGEYHGRQITVDAVDAVVSYGDGVFAVSAVNRDENHSHVLELDMTDTPVSLMRIHTLNGRDANSYNDVEKTDVSVKTSEWIPFEKSVTLEPHSVNIIEIK